MYAKVFSQIFESSIAEDPETRFTFMDLLILADKDGNVDRTYENIARTTNRPLDVIKSTMAKLEMPDPNSRSPKRNGARIERIDDRPYGWRIVNYDSYRMICNEEQRRERTNNRVKNYRERATQAELLAEVEAVTENVTPSNAGNAKQIQRQMHIKSQDHALLRSRWCDAYLKKFGDKYLHSGAKDTNGEKKLLGGASINDIIETAQKAWDNMGGKNSWHCNKSVTLAGLACNWNEIRRETAKSGSKMF